MCARDHFLGAYGATGVLAAAVDQGNSEDLTLDLRCRAIFRTGQTKVEVTGPLTEGWEWKVAEDSRRYRSKHG